MYFVRIFKKIDRIITAPHCSIISCVIFGNTSMVMIYRKLSLMATTNYTSVHLTLVPNWPLRQYREYLALSTSIIISICVLYHTLLHYIIWVSLDCLFNSLFRWTTNTTHQTSTLLTICEENPPVTLWRIILLTLQSLLTKHSWCQRG